MNSKMCSDTVKIIKNPHYFEQLANKTEELALLAVSRDPSALKVIPVEYQTKQVVELALKGNCLMLEHVHQAHLYYSFAIMEKKCEEDLHKLLDLIPQLGCEADLVRKVAYSCSLGDIHSWLKKFDVRVWDNESLIKSFYSGDNHWRLIINFILESDFPLEKELRHWIVRQCMVTNNVSLPLKDDDIKRYIKTSGFPCAKLHESKWCANLDLTFKDLFEIKDKNMALRLCKNPTYDFIMACFVEGYIWDIFSICLNRHLLNGQILADVATSIPNKFNVNDRGEKFENLEQAISPENLEQIKNIGLTMEQLNDIKEGGELLYEFLKKNNKNVQQNFRVVVIDNVLKKNYEQLDWNFEKELKALVDTHGKTISHKIKKETYKFYNDNVLIKSVIVLN